MYIPARVGQTAPGQKKESMQNVTTKSIHSYIFCQGCHRMYSGVMRKKAERNHRRIKTGASAPVFSLRKETETQYPVAFQKLPGKIDEIPPHWEVVERRKLCYNRRQWTVSVLTEKRKREDKDNDGGSGKN